jgi:hypothetical protein
MLSSGSPAVAVTGIATPAVAGADRQEVPRPSTARTVRGVVDDVVLLLLGVVLLPVIIILAGAPIALLVRIVREILHRL